MQFRIAVADPLPLLHRGVTAVLEEMGLTAEAPNDLLAWLRDDQPKVVVLTVMMPEDWRVLEAVDAARDDRTVVIALLAEPALEEHVRAVRLGAGSTLPRNAPPAQLREVIAAALHGRCVLPGDVVRALASLPLQGVDPRIPSASERDWLQSLSDGVTVGALAERAGYSERMMFRLLRGLYVRLGAENRAAALMKARDAGWIR